MKRLSLQKRAVRTQGRLTAGKTWEQGRVKRMLTGFIAISLIVLPVFLLAPEDARSEETEQENTQVNASLQGVQALGTVTVTATKTGTPLELLPVTAHSVDRDKIESQPDTFRNDYGGLLMDVPGVFVAPSALTAPPWVNLRGTGYFVGRTLYLVDGMPVTSATTPMLTTTINNHDIERADVLLGPSSALYGANAAGGVVNLITRKGTETTGANASVSYGSHNTVRPHLSLGDQKGDLNYYVSYSGDYTDGFKNLPVDGMLYLYNNNKKGYLSSSTVDDANWDKSYLAGKFGWENSNGTGMWFGYNYADLFISGGQTNRILLDNGQQGVGTFRFYTPVGDFMRVTASAGHQFWDRPSKTNKGLKLVGGNLVLDTTQNLANDSKLTRIPLELQADFYFLENNILTAGIFHSTEKLESAKENWATGAYVSNSETNTDQNALYIQNQTFLLDNKLSVLLGMRYDEWKYYDVYDSASAPKDRPGFSKDTVTYRGGLKYRINENFAVRTSAGTAFWPGAASWFFLNTNTGSTWREANPNLKPEKTWMADVGLDAVFPRWGSAFSITPYYGEIDDMIIYRYDPHPTLAGVTIVRTRNASSAEIYGVELQGSQAITDQVSCFASLTLNHSRITEDPANEGHQVSNSPDYFGSVGVKYKNPDAVNASAALRFTAERFYDNENTQLDFYCMKPYEDLGVKIWRDWKLSNKMTLTTTVSGSNLLDQDHETEFIYVDPGRTFMGEVAVKYNF